ncbi:MAG: hypothetical protein HOH73_01210 [Alphaproteobacteria bacterium]|jgi:hypothetical protein|nr:hypothetical protein [Alphaproteobacteria bacterium]
MTNNNQANRTCITKEKYHWGEFRKISVGIDFSVMIYPENWNQIDSLKAGDSLFYKDDQNARWDVRFDGQNLSFKDRDCHSCKVEVKKSELLMN